MKLNWQSRGETPIVMGIINCTPDSFFEGSRQTAALDSVRRALEMEEQGALIIDIGGESSRPGSAYISSEEEIARILPVINGIRKKSEVFISVDTRKRIVAEKVVEAGADMINDISALEDSPDMADFLAVTGVPVVLMHKKGLPLDMQNNPVYSDAVAEILKYLEERRDFALSRGIPGNNIVLDPGIGFGKRHEDNMALLKNLSVLRASGCPVLIGLSRKSLLGRITGRETEARLAGTIAAHMWCLQKGAHILRVHDVPEAVDTVAVYQELS